LDSLINFSNYTAQRLPQDTAAKVAAHKSDYFTASAGTKKPALGKKNLLVVMQSDRL
jgi:hypothetical protein